MKNHKATRGVTLVELIVSIAMLTVVMAAAGSAMFAASQSYAVTRKMQEDEYNVRLALLSITREVHRGVSDLTVTGSELHITAYDETTKITYEFNPADKMLYRTGDLDDTPVQFASTELESFRAEIEDDKWLTLTVTGRNGLNLKTTVAIFRVPPPTP